VIYLDERFIQQLKKGVLELLVLDTICQGPTYGYALLTTLKENTNGSFTLKEGTLYPILYRLEDDGLIASSWSAAEGRTAPKKIYTATALGHMARQQRHEIWQEFAKTVDTYLEKGCD
jgi:PadR family transcriptional regulator PadR